MERFRRDPSAGDSDEELDALVDELLGAKPRPVDWRRIGGSDAARRLFELDAWVRWLVCRYAIDPREIPPCWADHGELIEELSALHTAHQAAFDPAGPPTGPADWHATFANTRVRLHVAVPRTGCRVGQHRPSAVLTWTAVESSAPDY